jgi:hypothetical protein
MHTTATMNATHVPVDLKQDSHTFVCMYIRTHSVPDDTAPGDGLRDGVARGGDEKFPITPMPCTRDRSNVTSYGRMWGIVLPMLCAGVSDMPVAVVVSRIRHRRMVDPCGPLMASRRSEKSMRSTVCSSTESSLWLCICWCVYACIYMCLRPQCPYMPLLYASQSKAALIVHVFVCVYVCMCRVRVIVFASAVPLYVNTCLHTRTHVYVPPARVHTLAYIFTHIYHTHAHAYYCYALIYIYIYIYICMYMYIYIHTYHY